MMIKIPSVKFYNIKYNDFSIDATDTNCIGRYVNDICASKANTEVRRVFFDEKVHLVFFALKDIQKGDELRYDYGVPGLEWRVSTHL